MSSMQLSSSAYLLCGGCGWFGNARWAAAAADVMLGGADAEDICEADELRDMPGGGVFLWPGGGVLRTPGGGVLLTSSIIERGVPGLLTDGVPGAELLDSIITSSSLFMVTVKKTKYKKIITSVWSTYIS
jgi:hypothetical protein